MENTNLLLKKYFKNYIDGKNIINKNSNKAQEYFKESLELLAELRKNHSDKIQKHKDIINKTETECTNYISLTIESSIESEFNKPDLKINNNKLLTNLIVGDLELIKNAIFGQINFNELINKQTILHYAIKYGDTTFLKYAFKLGARIDTTNFDGNTLLEYACLEQDPNMINFLGLYGANIQKHLYFRDGTNKYTTNNDSIDINILLKTVISYIPIKKNNKEINNKIYNKLKLIENSINLNEKINLNDNTFRDLFLGLMHLLYKLPETSALTYLSIITEELSYIIINNKLGCPPNKLEIILTNLVPFIDYPFNISIDWVISLELKYLILKLIKNSIDIKKELMEKLWEIYIKSEIIQEDYLGCLISQWIAKIKV
jgi:ankyrin repeat protein